MRVLLFLPVLLSVSPLRFVFSILQQTIQIPISVAFPARTLLLKCLWITWDDMAKNFMQPILLAKSIQHWIVALLSDQIQIKRMRGMVGLVHVKEFWGIEDNHISAHIQFCTFSARYLLDIYLWFSSSAQSLLNPSCVTWCFSSFQPYTCRSIYNPCW